MNQILFTEPQKGKNRGNKEPADIKKVTIFFVIVIIIFAVLLIGIGIYQLQQNNEQIKYAEAVPEINVSQEEDLAKISVTHNKTVSKLIYTINNGVEKTVSGNGTSTLNAEVELETGDNLLTIRAIDVTGKESTTTHNYKVETDLKIELAVIGNNIKITATDYKEKMQYITYKWNNEEEKRVDAEGENQDKIEIEETIPVGLNTLTINAVNNNNIVRTKEQEIKGVNKPVITAVQDGDSIVITVTDDEGIETIEHNLNNGLVSQTIPGQGLKEINYSQIMVEGDNYVTITVTSISGAKTVFYGLCKN